MVPGPHLNNTLRNAAGRYGYCTWQHPPLGPPPPCCESIPTHRSVCGLPSSTTTSTTTSTTSTTSTTLLTCFPAQAVVPQRPWFMRGRFMWLYGALTEVSLSLSFSLSLCFSCSRSLSLAGSLPLFLFLSSFLSLSLSFSLFLSTSLSYSHSLSPFLSRSLLGFGVYCSQWGKPGLWEITSGWEGRHVLV